jgi:hypothetical protein
MRGVGLLQFMRVLLTSVLLILLLPRCHAVGKSSFPPVEGDSIFGSWRVVAYRFGDGPSVGEREARVLLGAAVRYGRRRGGFGWEICTSPPYETTRVTEEQFFREYRTSLRSIGIGGGAAEVVEVRCRGQHWTSPGSLLIRLRGGRMLTLWDGVYFVLVRRQGGRGPARHSSGEA